MNVTLTAFERTVELDMPEGDHIAKVIGETGDWYERAMLDDIYARKPQGTAIDVGACFGTHTAWLSAACGMKVIAIEPNSDVFELLTENIARNVLGARAIQAAAGNRGGTVSVMPPMKNNIGATKVRLHPRAATEGVPMLTIDSLCIDDVGLIKIDTEGMELRVLEGAQETIKRCHPLIYVEAGAKTYGPVRHLLERLGYRQFGKFNKTATYGFEPLPITVSRAAGEPSTLSATIMAHRKRERFIPYLRERLGAVPVIWDEHDDRWDTGRRAMLAFDPTKTHHIVIQDDAIIPRDFIPAVEAAIQTVPDNPISFYTGRVRPNHRFVDHMVAKAKAQDCTWIAMEGPWWGPAVVIPTRLIPAMVAWCDKREHIPNYDRRMSRFFLSQNIDCYYSVPSLVSHRVGPENPSLVVGRGSGHGRVAFQFIGEDASALDVEWTTGAVRPGRDAPRKVSP